MIINLGDALEAVILNHSEVQPTQENFLKALKNFFEQNLQEYTTPSFLMEGVITTPYGPIPHISNSGRLASITVLPVTTVEWESIIKPINDKAILEYEFYVRLSQVIFKFFNERIFLLVDGSGISAAVQIPIKPMTFLTTKWGRFAQNWMDNKRPDAHNSWIDEMNTIGKTILSDCAPNIFPYSSPCAGGSFAGVMTVKFN